MDVREHISLGQFTALGIGGLARYCLTIERSDDVGAAVEFARARSLPWAVVGSGQSTLVTDQGFDGVVIRLFGAIRQYLPAGAMIFSGDRFAEQGSIGAVTLTSGISITEVAEFHWLNQQGKMQVIPSDRWGSMAVQHAPGILVGIVPKHDIRPTQASPRPSGNAAQVFQSAHGQTAQAISEVGWAGKALGKAKLWSEDPTWVIVEPGAKADDVVQLMSLVKQQVRDTLGIQLRDAISYLGM